MDPVSRVLFTLGTIFISTGCGWLVRRGSERQILPLSEKKLDTLRRRLQTSAIFFLLPFSAMLSLWGLPQPRPELLVLPVLGLLSYISGGLLAILVSIILHLNRNQTGSLFCCGTFTNIGAVGGLVSLIFLGENSIALVALYRLLEELYYFGIAFPIAKWFGTDSTKRFPDFHSFRLSPILGAILIALTSGILLNLLDVPRPQICNFLASSSVIIGTTFFLFSIGLTLHFSRLAGDTSISLLLCFIKFIGIPLIVIPVAWLAGMGDFEGGLPLKTVVILCSMPVAMTALVPPAIFNLDLDLANACWILSTIGLLVLLPVLMLLLPML